VRAVVTRVTSASVTIGGEESGAIGAGLLVLLGVGHEDTASDAGALAKKIVELRIFRDQTGAMNRSLLETGGALLVVSQFTLFGDARKGRRPSFTAAASPARGRELYESFVAEIRALAGRVETGRFGATMAVKSVNDGPVTILIDTAKSF